VTTPTDAPELIELPDGSTIEGPLYGDQMPRLYVTPDRHIEPVEGCRRCGRNDHPPSGCGEYDSIEALQWSEGYGYELDPWQHWSLTNMMSTRPNGMWAAPDCLLIVSRQNGKGREALTNRVYTRLGWKTFMDIQPGDEVIGSDGKFTRVVSRSTIVAGASCYEVEFTDGAKITVSGTHLWHVRHKARSLWQNVSTEDLYTGTGTSSVGYRRPDNGRMEYNWRVRCDAVPETPEVSLPIDPYLLGYWLGDGTHKAARMTIGKEDLRWSVSRLERAGVVCTKPTFKGGESTAYDVGIQVAGAAHGEGFIAQAKALGLWGSKHIPEIYLTASVAQRKALLAGLMDSDGSITRNNATPQCEFSTSFPALADGFRRLARSLGIRVTPKWRKTARKDNCRFLFTAPFCPFELPRKAERWKPPASNRHELMSITSITPVESVPTRCIKVAAPDGVYLTGELFTPTHNTILEVRELAGLFVFHEELIIHTAHQFKTSVNHFNRLKRVLNEYPSLRRRVKRIAGSHGEVH
jgi:hypothetical protein